MKWWWWWSCHNQMADHRFSSLVSRARFKYYYQQQRCDYVWCVMGTEIASLTAYHALQTHEPWMMWTWMVYILMWDFHILGRIGMIQYFHHPRIHTHRLHLNICVHILLTDDAHATTVPCSSESNMCFLVNKYRAVMRAALVFIGLYVPYVH